ncbi:MAG: hypothetical protein KDI14_16940 [Halioglobus sp.]|nr:hypothetical protein [Halioglobus sp.]
MNEFLLLKFAHIIALVYWLGGDLGTFLASKQVINRELSAESRHTALKIMLACDMGPKLAMPLIFGLGVHLAWLGGMLAISGNAVALAWLLSLYWFAVVMVLSLYEGRPFTILLSKIDFYFRIVVALAIFGWAGSLLLGTQGEAAHWAAWKLIVFAAMVVCGIAIRLRLKPFLPAFLELVSKGPSEAGNRVMEKSIGQCRPFVWCIWAGLFLNTALGVHLIG